MNTGHTLSKPSLIVCLTPVGAEYVGVCIVAWFRPQGTALPINVFACQASAADFALDRPGAVFRAADEP